MPEQNTNQQGGYTLHVCTECLDFPCMHPDGVVCTGAEYKAQTFADKAEHDAKKAQAATRAMLRRAHVATETVCNRNGGRADALCATLRAMFDVACVLEGESLGTFATCAEFLARANATLRYDSAPLSVGFEIRGIVGACVFHRSDRTWACHS